MKAAVVHEFGHPLVVDVVGADIEIRGNFAFDGRRVSAAPLFGVRNDWD